MSHALIRLALVKMFKLPVNFLCISSEILNEKTHLHSFLTNLADVSFCPSNEWVQSHLHCIESFGFILVTLCTFRKVVKARSVLYDRVTIRGKHKPGA